jgi:proteasome assembly chaperone 3
MADQASQVVKDPFPARTKTASGSVNSIPTEVMSMSFADKILITISQQGRLAQWVRLVHMPFVQSGR